MDVTQRAGEAGVIYGVFCHLLRLEQHMRF